MDTTYNIYAIVSPYGIVGYVGRTKKDVRERVSEHFRNARLHPHGLSELTKWINSFKPDKPSVALLESGIAKPKASEREVYWIRKFLSEGHPLVNQWGRGRNPIKTWETQIKLISKESIAQILEESEKTAA